MFVEYYQRATFDWSILLLTSKRKWLFSVLLSESACLRLSLTFFTIFALQFMASENILKNWIFLTDFFLKKFNSL